jgi:hypothetical protein
LKHCTLIYFPTTHFGSSILRLSGIKLKYVTGPKYI